MESYYPPDSIFRKIEEKAYRLLMKNLSRNQRDMLSRYGYFAVKGGDGENYYLIMSMDNRVKVCFIYHDSTYGIWVVANSYCVSVDYDEAEESLPWPDRMLAFKKLIESKKGEIYFLRHAVVTGEIRTLLPRDFKV